MPWKGKSKDSKVKSKNSKGKIQKEKAFKV
jgi:hypothetical protein